MAALTLGTVTVKDGANADTTVQNYADPNRGNAKGPVVALILADGTVLALGQGTKAQSVPVTLASNDDAVAALGAAGDAAVAAGAAGTLSAKLRRLTQGVEDLKTGVVLAAGANAVGTVAVGAETVGALAGAGQLAVTASALALGSSTPLTKGVLVKAPSSNSLPVYVGPSGVSTSTGFQLAPGEALFVPVDNVTDVYAVSTTTGNSVHWIGY